MPKTVIMDDNHISRFLIKNALQGEGLKACHVDGWQALMEESKASSIELVLINQHHRNNSGWSMFNRIKSFNPEAPVMIYVLPDHRRPSIDWIVKAVLEAVSPKSAGTAQSRSSPGIQNRDAGEKACF